MFLDFLDNAAPTGLTPSPLTSKVTVPHPHVTVTRYMLSHFFILESFTNSHSVLPSKFPWLVLSIVSVNFQFKDFSICTADSSKFLEGDGLKHLVSLGGIAHLIEEDKDLAPIPP